MSCEKSSMPENLTEFWSSNFIGCKLRGNASSCEAKVFLRSLLSHLLTSNFDTSTMNLSVSSLVKSQPHGCWKEFP